MGDKLLKITAVAPGPGRLIMEPYVGKQQDAIKAHERAVQAAPAMAGMMKAMPQGQ